MRMTEHRTLLHSSTTVPHTGHTTDHATEVDTDAEELYHSTGRPYLELALAVGFTIYCYKYQLQVTGCKYLVVVQVAGRRLQVAGLK
jgi:hypothetical protein